MHWNLKKEMNEVNSKLDLAKETIFEVENTNK